MFPPFFLLAFSFALCPQNGAARCRPPEVPQHLFPNFRATSGGAASSRAPSPSTLRPRRGRTANSSLFSLHFSLRPQAAPPFLLLTFSFVLLPPSPLRASVSPDLCVIPRPSSSGSPPPRAATCPDKRAGRLRSDREPPTRQPIRILPWPHRSPPPAHDMFLGENLQRPPAPTVFSLRAGGAQVFGQEAVVDDIAVASGIDEFLFDEHLEGGLHAAGRAQGVAGDEGT